MSDNLSISYPLRVNQFAHFLIKQHIVGSLRDEADFHMAQEHALTSLFFVKLFLEDSDRSKEESLKMIKDIEEDLRKFEAKKS